MDDENIFSWECFFFLLLNKTLFSININSSTSSVIRLSDYNRILKSWKLTNSPACSPLNSCGSQIWDNKQWDLMWKSFIPACLGIFQRSGLTGIRQFQQEQLSSQSPSVFFVKHLIDRDLKTSNCFISRQSNQSCVEIHFVQTFSLSSAYLGPFWRHCVTKMFSEAGCVAISWIWESCVICLVASSYSGNMELCWWCAKHKIRGIQCKCVLFL